MNSFKTIFISVVIGTLMLAIAVLINVKRPASDIEQPTAEFVRATGKCASCHLRETAAVVHQFERSKHAQRGVTCLDCHRPLAGQQQYQHRGFTMTKELTAKNCSQCHLGEYEQFLRSRHAAPSWAAVNGAKDFTAEQITHAEKYHQGSVQRPANVLAFLEGVSASQVGCQGCHDIGKPNSDGSIGNCTDCHARHSASIALARQPQTCGQCHMGPDHSQLEIYHESKHGVLFHAQQASMRLNVTSSQLTTAEMPIPTCATCHLSGLDGLRVTHDTSERLSYWLFSAVSDKRPTFTQGQNAMQEVCLKCHTTDNVKRFYQQAEQVVIDTNRKVREAQTLMKSLRNEKLLSPTPFDEPLEFIYFDYWHYYGRTAKHGAFMGGADFVQWHGNYELLLKMTEMKEIAKNLRQQR